MRYMLISAILLSLGIAAEDTTQTRLAKYVNDLVDAWKTYPLEKDETVRKQKITDLNTAMTSSINKLPAPENMTLDKVVNTYMSNLEKAKTQFRLEKMQNERMQFIASSTQVFRREIQFASDLKEDRTPHKCFEIVLAWCTDAKPRLTRIPEEAGTNFFTALGEAFTLMLKASHKDEGDPTAIYDKQLKEIRRLFPTANEAFQKVNGPIATMLEGASKQANTFNKK